MDHILFVQHFNCDIDRISSTATEILDKIESFKKNERLRTIIKIKLWLIALLIGIILVDMIGMQNDPGNALLLFFGIWLMSLIVPVLLLIYYSFFYLILYFSTNKYDSKKTPKIFLLLTLSSIMLFQFIWWSYYYTDISLLRRIILWNIVTIVFPLIPALTFWQHINKVKNK